MDCDDGDLVIYLGAFEVCDGIDNDCDDDIDEGIFLLGKVCEEGFVCVMVGVWICAIGNTFMCNGGPKFVGFFCDDGNFCIYLDSCVFNLMCGGILYICNDGLDAIIDICDGNGGCSVTVLFGKCVVGGIVYSDGDFDLNNVCKVCLLDMFVLQFSF